MLSFIIINKPIDVSAIVYQPPWFVYTFLFTLNVIFWLLAFKSSKEKIKYFLKPTKRKFLLFTLFLIFFNPFNIKYTTEGVVVALKSTHNFIDFYLIWSYELPLFGRIATISIPVDTSDTYLMLLILVSWIASILSPLIDWLLSCSIVFIYERCKTYPNF